MFYFATSVAASDAIVAYRSNTGSCASDALNCPKIRIWNSTGNGSWGPEVELATAGSPIRWAVVKYSTVSPKIVLVTSSDDANLDAYICPRTANCSSAGGWVVQNNIGALSSTSAREFDLEFETRSGRAFVVYSARTSAGRCDLGYKVLPQDATAFGDEECIDDNATTNDKHFSWVVLDRNKTNTSNGLVVAGFNMNDSDIEAWRWDGGSWGLQFSIATGATSLGGGQGLAVAYAADSSIAMVLAGNGAAGDVLANYFSGTWWTNASLLDMTSSTDDVQWLTLKADPATDDLQATAVTSTGSLSTAYWNGALWSKTVNLDNSVDATTSRTADFVWDPSGSTGRLVWDTDTTGTTLAERSCSPECTAGTTNISAYNGTGAWLDLYTNPTAGDSINLLGLRLPSDFTIGAFFWDGTSYLNYGNSTISTNTTVTTFGASSLSYKLVSSNQLFSFLVNGPANGTNFEPLSNVTINFTVNDTANDACLRVFGSNYSPPSNESLIYEQCNGLNAVPPAFNSTIYNWTTPVINNESGLDLTKLVFLYHLDNRSEYGESSGEGSVVYDFSGNGNNATLRSNASGKPPIYNKSGGGKLGTGLVFNGTTAGADQGTFLLIPSTSSGPLSNGTVMQNFTAMAWINVKAVPDGGGGGIFFRGNPAGSNEFKLQVEQNQVISASIDAVDYSTTQTINLEQWHHVALVRYSNGTFEIYLDGIMNRTGTETGTLDFSGALYIGIDADAVDSGFGEYFNGTMDEIALFNRTMLSTEILDFYKLKNGTYYWYANMSNNTNTQLSTQRFFTIGSTFGYLNVSLLTPVGASSQTQNETFSLQANVTCIGASSDTCGFVNATLRYNASANPDTNVQGGGTEATPFFSSQANPQNCGTLTPNASCNLTWTINTTGLVGREYLLDAIFASDRPSVTTNDTQNAEVTITAPEGGGASNIVGLNVSYNATTITAGSQLRLTPTGFDVNGVTNNTGGFNFTWANSTTTGSTYVSGNESTAGVFNFTRNGTFAFNVSAFHNRSAWNVSLAQNVTVTASTIVGLNFTLNTTSAVAGNQVQITVTGFDRFGNINNSGGFNFTSNNSGVTYVSGNNSATAVFNLSRNGTFSFNVSSSLNSSAWNSTGPNVTVTAATITGLNFSANATSITARSQVLLTATGFDRFGNINNSGGFNFTWANSTASGSRYVSGNESTTGVFNFTRNGTFAFNVSSSLNSSAWNSTGPNVTVTAGTIVGLNVTYNATSIVAGGQVQLTATGFDVDGNINNSGGFNFTWANSTASGSAYVSGNETTSGVFNFTRNGTFAFNVSVFLNGSAWNVSIAQNVTVTAGTILGVNFSSNATSVAAGSQVLLTPVGFDRFGNTNNSGGFNFTWANSTTTGSAYVSGNESTAGVFNFTRNGTFAFNVSSSLNTSAWNITGPNVSVTAGSIVGLNFSYNSTNLAAGSQLLLTPTGFDRFGNTNSSGGFNFTWANSTPSGSSYVSGNTTTAGVFNFTTIGTFAFNVSSSLNSSAWNVSLAQNVTITAASIVGLNFSANATSVTARSQVLLTGTGFDRFGNANSSGSFNFTWANSTTSGSAYVSGNETTAGVFNFTRNGTFAFNISSSLNSSAWNATGPNVTVTAGNIVGLNFSYNTTSVVAGGQLRLSATGYDLDGNANNSGGFNFTFANSTTSGASYVGGNETTEGVFNFTRIGTFAFNVSSSLNSSAWNITGSNVTVGAASIVGLNFSANATSVTARSQVLLTPTGFDRFGNANNSGGFNFTWANSTTSGSSYVSGNESTAGVLNFTLVSTFSFNVSSSLNSSAWNVTGPNVTVTAGSIVGLNVSYNVTNVVAGSQLLLTAFGFDFDGNANNSGGFNFTWANATVSGSSYISGNQTINGAFNFTQVGTFAFNASSSLNSSAWNVSLSQNITVTAGSVVGLNFSSNATTVAAGGQVLLTPTGFDRFGNANSSGGFNFTWANSTTSGSAYVSGNETTAGVLNFTRNATFAFNISSSLNSSAWNITGPNVTVTASSIFSLNVSLNSSAIVAGDQLLVSAIIFDRFGNLNSSGGANFSGNASGIVQVGSNGTASSVFNITANGTWSFNVSSIINSSIWNSTGDNVTVASANIYSLNLTLNASSAVAGSQITARVAMMDRFGNLNFTGGANYSGNASGITQVGSNGSSSVVFNLTRNGTFSFNVTPALNLSAWNATGDNVTILSDYVAGVNSSVNASSITAGEQVALSALTFDRFGNLNFSGGGVFVGNASGVTQVGSNGSASGIFNLTRNGTFAFNVSSVLNSTVWNTTGQNITVASANMVGINASLNTTAVNVGNRVLLSTTGFDRFGNLNFTGGFNYSRNNSNVDQVDSNGSTSSIFSAAQSGSTSFNISSVQDLGIWNSTGDNLTISLQAAPASPTQPLPTGSSGPVTFPPKVDFMLEPILFTESLLQGEDRTVYFRVNNTGETAVNISIQLENLTSFAILPFNAFSLGVGQSRLVRLELFALTAQKPGVYIGKVIVRGGRVEKVVHGVVEVRQREALFDVRLVVQPGFKKIAAGNKTRALIELQNIGLKGQPVDVELRMYVVDLERKKIVEAASEFLAVTTNVSITREITLPPETTTGRYLFIVNLTYNDVSIESFDTIQVVEPSELEPAPVEQAQFQPIVQWQTVLLAIVVVILVALLLFVLARRKKSEENPAEQSKV